MTNTRKILNSDTLRAIAQRAEDHGYAQQINPEVLGKLDPQGVHMIGVVFPHVHVDEDDPEREERNVRVIMMVKVLNEDQPVSALMELSARDFASLDEFSANTADDDVPVEDEDK